MTDPRAAVFAAIRDKLPDIWADPGNILAMDNLLDAFGFPRAGQEWHINAAGLKIIKDSEGCELTAYRDPVGILTIGYGSTGPHVKPGMTITREQAEALLLDDLARFEAGVEKLAHGTNNQKSALVSFAFNLGLEALKRSTLLRLHNEGQYAAAQAEFGKWVYAGKQKLNGLVTRRAKEAALYGAVS